MHVYMWEYGVCVPGCAVHQCLVSVNTCVIMCDWVRVQGMSVWCRRVWLHE